MVDVQLAPAVIENRLESEEDEEDEEEDEVWLREIEEVAAQFVCLVLEDQPGAQPMGGEGKSPAALLTTSNSQATNNTSSNAPEVCMYTMYIT